MTCIIGHRDGWMVADKRVTFNDLYICPFKTKKVARGKSILIGIAGDPSVAATAVAMSEGGFAHEPSDVARWLYKQEPDETTALVVHNGTLWECNAKGLLYEVEYPYWVIGISEYAKGFLDAHAALGNRVTPALAQQAVFGVSTTCAGVSPDSEVFEL